jgi:hypothetical protein
VSVEKAWQRAMRVRWKNAMAERKYKEAIFGLRLNDEYSPLAVLYDLIDPKGWMEFNPPNWCWRGTTGHQFHQSVFDATGMNHEDLVQFCGKSFHEAQAILKRYL